MEIVWPDECYIYPWHRENFIEILQCKCTLNLDGHDNFIIRHACIIWPICDAEPIGTESSADTTSAQRRIFRIFYNALCLLTRIDHWDNYAPCSGIQRPLEPLDAIDRDTHHGGAGSSIGSTYRVTGGSGMYAGGGVGSGRATGSGGAGSGTGS